MANYSEEIFAEIEKYLNEKDWKFAKDTERGRLYGVFGLRSKIKKCDFSFSVRENAFSFTAVCPLGADEGNMNDIAEYFTRLNYDLMHGQFQLDYNDGEIRYRTSLICEDTIPTQAQISTVMLLSLTMLERYGDTIAELLFGMITPEEAYKREIE